MRRMSVEDYRCQSSLRLPCVLVASLIPFLAIKQCPCQWFGQKGSCRTGSFLVSCLPLRMMCYPVIADYTKDYRFCRTIHVLIVHAFFCSTYNAAPSVFDSSAWRLLVRPMTT